MLFQGTCLPTLHDCINYEEKEIAIATQYQYRKSKLNIKITVIYPNVIIFIIVLCSVITTSRCYVIVSNHGHGALLYRFVITHFINNSVIYDVITIMSSCCIIISTLCFMSFVMISSFSLHILLRVTFRMLLLLVCNKQTAMQSEVCTSLSPDKCRWIIVDRIILSNL